MKLMNIYILYIYAASSHKRKNKKRVKPTAAPTTSSSSLSVDSGFLCCAHHEVMVAGLAMLGVGTPQNKGQFTPVLYSLVEGCRGGQEEILTVQPPAFQRLA